MKLAELAASMLLQLMTRREMINKSGSEIRASFERKKVERKG